MSEANLNTAIYDIALNIGTSLDVNTTINTALESYFRQLDCVGIVIFHEKTFFNAKPKTLKKNQQINQFFDQVIQNELLDSKEYFKINPTFIERYENQFYNLFELPNFGFLLIITHQKPLSMIVSKMLLKLNEKFANSILASIQHTKLLENEKILHQQAKMASMGEMIGNIAHQWRQPLSAISTLSTSAKLQIDLQLITFDEIQDAFEKIYSISLHLSNTIEDFRNFFKEDTEEKIFDIEQTIMESLKIVEANLKVNNIDVICKLFPSVISGKESSLKQAFINIINNAKDALLLEQNQELRERLLFIQMKKENHTTIVEFFDNAGGIPQDIIEKIFDPYFTTKHQSQGTGIGLYMTKQIVEKNSRGVITAQNITYTHNNNKYNGALFRLIL